MFVFVEFCEIVILVNFALPFKTHNFLIKTAPKEIILILKYYQTKNYYYSKHYDKKK